METDFSGLCTIIDILLGENGCPWDRSQTFQSMRQCILEETYEVIDAVNKNDNTALCEELGDVLMNVLLYSKLAERNGLFTIDDVLAGISNKMIFRHKHVFSNEHAETSEQALKIWEKSKQQEKSDENELSSVAAALPALLRTSKILKKAEKTDQVLSKPDKSAVIELVEKCSVLKKNATDNEKDALVGVLLIEVVKFSNFLEINPEISLTNALEQFINRFGRINRRFCTTS